jgi:CheY-like chemotaxis protein
MGKVKVLLVHWKASEAAGRVARLRSLGFDARHAAPDGMAGIKAMVADLPDLFVIDLERLPSQGRAVATALRNRKATRRIPLVFAGGEPEKVRKPRELFPDAGFATWENIGQEVAEALRDPPAAPVMPAMMAGYSGTPLVKKLAVRACSRVALLGAPSGFADRLAPFPDGVRFTTRAGAGVDLALLFVRSQRELSERFPPAVRGVADGGAVWIMWPKKTSGLASDLTQAVVRAFGLAAGWVDYKICAVDQVWSGLLFARRAGCEMS